MSNPRICKRCQQPIASNRMKCATCYRRVFKPRCRICRKAIEQGVICLPCQEGAKRAKAAHKPITANKNGSFGALQDPPWLKDRIAAYTLLAEKGLPLFQEARQ